jgi:hypothetical protein
MNRRPGHVKVTTEVGFCGFCGRPRNLRREEHQLGTLVRTIITCETCHRTLSSEIGVAQPEPVEAAEPVAEKPAAPAKAEAPAKPKRAAAKPAAKTPARRGGKPTSTATRKVSRSK